MHPLLFQFKLIYVFAFLVVLLLCGSAIAAFRSRKTGLSSQQWTHFGLWILILLTIGALLYKFQLFQRDLTVFSYGALLAPAFMLGIAVACYRAKNRGYDSNQIVDFSLVILISSVLGARLLYVLTNWDYFRFHLLEMIMIQKGGLIFYGGMILGLLAAFLFIAMKKWNRWQIADIMAPSIALGQAFGRVGCFLNGCCFGTLTNLPWGVQFPDESPASIEFGPLHLVHPVQLYSASLHLLFFFFLLWFDRRSRFEGQTFTVYIIGYGLLRFILEFFRGDNPSLISFLTLSQLISITIFSAGLILYRSLSRKNRLHAENN